MLLAQGVVDLSLKLNVRVNYLSAARKRVHFHMRRYRGPADRGHCAFVGFCGTTNEMMLAPSLEIEGLSRFFVCE
jgi:hypothetical protein